MRSSKEKYELCQLVLRTLDGSVTDDEFKRLEQTLVASEDMRLMYLLMLETYAHLQRPCGSFKMNAATDESDGFNSEFWRMLAKDEKESPSVSAPLIEPVSQERAVCTNRNVYAGRRFSKSAMVSIMASAAAILLLALFIRFAPVHDSHGQITDSFQAVSQDAGQALAKGRFLRNEPLLLEKGLIEIAMDSGGTVLVEAPAEIRLENDNQVFLVLGKLTAKVPPQAIGFTVRTPSASVVDYGTEFGVMVDRYATTDAHVLKGEIEMRLGSNIRVFEKSMRLAGKQAARASGENLTGIPAAAYQFTYEIPSPFEFYAKSLQPMMYFCAKGSAADSFLDIKQNRGVMIRLNKDVQISAEAGSAAPHPARSLYMADDAAGVSITNLQSVPQKGDYTICLWVRFDVIADQIVSQSLVSGRTQDSRYYRILNMNSDGCLEHSAFRSDRGKWRTVKSPTPLKTNVWYFVAVTNAFGTTKNMYINGRYVAEDAERQPSPLELYETLELGGSWESFAEFQGSVGDVLLFDRTLSKDEIQKLYESAVSKR